MGPATLMIALTLVKPPAHDGATFFSNIANPIGSVFQDPGHHIRKQLPTDGVDINSTSVGPDSLCAFKALNEKSNEYDKLDFYHRTQELFSYVCDSHEIELVGWFGHRFVFRTSRGTYLADPFAKKVRLTPELVGLEGVVTVGQWIFTLREGSRGKDLVEGTARSSPGNKKLAFSVAGGGDLQGLGHKVIVVEDDRPFRLWSADPDTGRAKEIRMPGHFLGFCDWGRDQIVVARGLSSNPWADPVKSTELVKFDLNSGSTRVLARLHGQTTLAGGSRSNSSVWLIRLVNPVGPCPLFEWKIGSKHSRLLEPAVYDVGSSN